MKSITEFTPEEAKKEFENARARQDGVNDSVRILFSPVRITEENIGRAASIYSRLSPTEYDTVVVVEDHEDDLSKRLSMPSHNEHQTPLGQVPVNDYLRNEFCDEDDDFFINDSGFHPQLSLFQQLMMLQLSLKDFNVLNIQISSRDEHIVKELVAAANELLASRKVLLVFCCGLNESSQNKDGLEKMKSITEADSTSKLLNLLNKHADCIEGDSAFKAGMLLARKWEATVHLLDEAKEVSAMAAYAEQERVFY